MRRLVMLAVLLGACGGATVVEEPAPTPPPVEPSVSEPIIAEGATAMEPVCFETERCDALDSDCDGHVDETCPDAPTAELEVGLAWNDASSLAVTIEPAPANLGGAALPIECANHTEPRRLRVHARALAAGDYRIAVTRTDACAAVEGTVASVSVSVLGRGLGTYNVLVGDRADVVSFTVTR